MMIVLWMTMMMIKKITILSFLCCVCFSSMLFAQHTDGGVWMSVGVSHEPVADFTIDVNEEIRYNVSVAELYQINTNIGVDYKLSKKFKTGC
ncbi:MAG: hypothetical protein V9F05_13150 [Chitinophagaceae bacterium]